MTVVDTNVLSELMKPEPNEKVMSWMDSLRPSQLDITAVSVAEILYGIGALSEGRRKQRLLEAARSMFEEDFKGRVLAFDEHAAVEYAAIVIQRERSGARISMPEAQQCADAPIAPSQRETRKTLPTPGWS